MHIGIHITEIGKSLHVLKGCALYILTHKLLNWEFSLMMREYLEVLVNYLKIRYQVYFLFNQEILIPISSLTRNNSVSKNKKVHFAQYFPVSSTSRASGMMVSFCRSWYWILIFDCQFRFSNKANSLHIDVIASS